MVLSRQEVKNFQNKYDKKHEYGIYDPKLKRKMRFAREFEERRELEQRAYDDSHTCPQCHCVLPHSGECDCGYVAKR